MKMREQPRDHVPVTPAQPTPRPFCRVFAVGLAGGWLTLALAAAFFAFGV